VEACRPWLRAELALVEPVVIVALGATAAKGMLGASFRVTRQRGELLAFPPSTATEGPPWIMATIHPSAVLRSNDRDEAYAGLVADLRVAAVALG
jgi:DNA polymerase